jgi:hypothetical protein
MPLRPSISSMPNPRPLHTGRELIRLFAGGAAFAGSRLQPGWFDDIVVPTSWRAPPQAFAWYFATRGSFHRKVRLAWGMRHHLSPSKPRGFPENHTCAPKCHQPVSRAREPRAKAGVEGLRPEATILTTRREPGSYRHHRAGGSTEFAGNISNLLQSTIQRSIVQVLFSRRRVPCPKGGCCP